MTDRRHAGRAAVVTGARARRRRRVAGALTQGPGYGTTMTLTPTAS